MKALLLAMLWAGACLAQVVTGVVERVAPDQISLRDNGNFTIDTNTELHGKPKPGSVVRLRYSGSRADVISVQTKVKGEVSDLRQGRWFVVRGVAVYILRDTRFGTSSRQLHAGQLVEVTGWLNAKGEVEAEQVILYNTDLPMRLE